MYVNHNSVVIMGGMPSQIIRATIVYSTVYSGADQRKYQSSASLAYMRGIHRWLVKSRHKCPVTQKCFHWMTSSCICGNQMLHIICYFLSVLFSIQFYTIPTIFRFRGEMSWSVWFRLFFIHPSALHSAVCLSVSLQWCHNERGSVSNYQRLFFAQLPVQARIKGNIKAPRHWPLCGEFTGDRGIPRTNIQ